MESLLTDSCIDLVESDVVFGPRTSLICDAHAVPFDDASLDGLIAQAVLEHVVDPYGCPEEFHRVLKPQGLVYAETAFMQQVHGGRYDFTRFTHLGHRRLFRGFEEIGSGAVCGPGLVLAWAYRYFLLSLARSKVARSLLPALTALTSFYLKAFDWHLIERPGALDAASAVYFLGQKSEHALTDRELAQHYRGALLG
jgi:SAM-dependent methyltransferase